MKTKTINFAGEEYEVTKLKVWKKPYNQIKVPKGWELLKDWEAAQVIREHPGFGDVNKSDYLCVWCAPV